MTTPRSATPARSRTPRPRLVTPFVLVLATATLGVSPARAHQYWLAPTRYDAKPHQPVDVGAFAGTGFRGEAKPWSPGRCVRFVARTTRLIDLSRAGAPGETAWTRFAPADDGGAMLAYESDFAPIELAADLFDAYLAEEGLTGPLAARRKAGTHAAGRERYRRCAKTWLAGRDPGAARRRRVAARSRALERPAARGRAAQDLALAVRRGRRAARCRRARFGGHGLAGRHRCAR